MIRGAALVSGGGTKLQALLDSVYFKEIPDFELVAVISSDPDAYALKRASNAKIPTFVVEPNRFPTPSSHSMAVANKLKDMDIDLVIVAGYKMPLGTIASTFKGRIIGVHPSLVPAFENVKSGIYSAVLERGVKITGATAYFANSQGDIGPIIMQKAVEVRPNDDYNSLRTRVIEEAEWKLLPKAVSLFCQNKLEIHGNSVIIKE